MNKEHCTVFGGSGFLGSYLVDELITQNYQVTIADVIPPPKRIKRAKFIQCDISNYEEVKKSIFKDTNYVFNYAGFANLDDAVQDPIKTIKLNILGNTHCLEASRNSNVKHFIYASSAYAMSNQGSFYGLSKFASEKVIAEYYQRYRLNFTTIRFGSVYGESENRNNYLYNLIEHALESGEIDHPGDGEELREYIHAKDCAQLVVKMIGKKEYLNDYFMLTGLEKLTKKELFETINEILGGTLKIKYKKNSDITNHYKFTPYSFQPEPGCKVIANPYIDMGQGILKCIENIYQKSKRGKDGNQYKNVSIL